MHVFQIQNHFQLKNLVIIPHENRLMKPHKKFKKKNQKIWETLVRKWNNFKKLPSHENIRYLTYIMNRTDHNNFSKTNQTTKMPKIKIRTKLCLIFLRIIVKLHISLHKQQIALRIHRKNFAISFSRCISQRKPLNMQTISKKNNKSLMRNKIEPRRENSSR